MYLPCDVRETLDRSEWPNGRTSQKDQRAENDERLTRKRGPQRAQKRPGQLDKNPKLQYRIDNGLREIGLEIRSRIEVGDQKRADITQDIPDAIQTEDGQRPPYTPREE